jgi:hypothetical protein
MQDEPPSHTAASYTMTIIRHFFVIFKRGAERVCVEILRRGDFLLRRFCYGKAR